MTVFKTKIMAIFHQKETEHSVSESFDVDKVIERAHVLQNQGADIIDIGAATALLGVSSVTAQEERECLVPVLKAVKSALRIPVSLDVLHLEVAQEALFLGADLINDLSGFRDPVMRRIAANAHADICIVHRPQHLLTAQHRSLYETAVLEESIDWLDKQTRLLLHDGVESHRIIIDPGIGLGKTQEENFAILRHIKKYQELGFRMSMKIDHKSLFSSQLHSDSNRILPAMVALNTFFMLSHVYIIRVHDVQAHRDAFNYLYAIINP